MRCVAVSSTHCIVNTAYRPLARGPPHIISVMSAGRGWAGHDPFTGCAAHTPCVPFSLSYDSESIAYPFASCSVASACNHGSSLDSSRGETGGESVTCREPVPVRSTEREGCGGGESILSDWLARLCRSHSHVYPLVSYSNKEPPATRV